MQRIRHQSRLKDKADFRFPWKREMITPMQTTQGPSNHYLMLQQSFQFFTTEDSRATLQPGSEPETTGANGRDNLCCSHWDFLPGSIFMASISTSGSWNTATLPKGLSEWKLKVLFPHVRILKEMATMKVFIFVTLANEFHFVSSCCKAIAAPISSGTENWNENHDFSETGVDSRRECLFFYKALLIIL